MGPHRSRLAPVVIDVGELDAGTAFWSAALAAAEEPLPADSRTGYRRPRLPDTAMRVLLQLTSDPKTGKERMHLDIETDDIETDDIETDDIGTEVRRLEALGATRWDHQQERGHDFWVTRDSRSDEFCVLQTAVPRPARRPGSVAVAASPVGVRTDPFVSAAPVGGSPPSWNVCSDGRGESHAPDLR